MREIKFRAWHEGIMITEIIGSSDGHITGVSTDDILMQYTGLKDRNGVEIYKGDILEENFMFDTKYYDKDNSDFAIVKYEEMRGDVRGGIGFNITTKNGTPLDIKYCKVIGNLHENPELKQSII